MPIGDCSEVRLGGIGDVGTEDAVLLGMEEAVEDSGTRYWCRGGQLNVENLTSRSATTQFGHDRKAASSKQNCWGLYGEDRARIDEESGFVQCTILAHV